MKAERKQALRKWATIMVPTLSLLLTCLMGPIAFTLKVTVKDMVRQELGTCETVAVSDVRWKEHRDRLNEVFKRWDQDLAVLREKCAGNETSHYKLMLEFGNRLSSVETKIELLLKESQRDRKLPTGSTDTSGPSGP